MATDCIRYRPGLTASGAIAKYRMLVAAAGSKVAQAVANSTRLIGVSYSTAAQDGDTIDVASIQSSEGPILIECGGAIAALKYATPDADGKAVTADDGDLQCLQAYANGDIGEFYPIGRVT